MSVRWTWSDSQEDDYQLASVSWITLETELILRWRLPQCHNGDRFRRLWDHTVLSKNIILNMEIVCLVTLNPTVLNDVNIVKSLINLLLLLLQHNIILFIIVTFVTSIFQKFTKQKICELEQFHLFVNIHLKTKI